MTTKRISQIVSADGKPVACGTSAPGCFIHDGVNIDEEEKTVWGHAFATPTGGNNVEFYVTGEEYFDAVYRAMSTAKKSIYIAGWQVNFDVELSAGKTLFQCLKEALDKNADLHVYVMPWLSPKAWVDTGDFETMMAVFHLNVGLKTARRAYALPAIAQSDMPAAFGMMFSHHQKLVVIDDERAFLGGIDLAYGRRDDGRCLLSAEGRKGNELYNPCIPPVHTMSNREQSRFMTRMELFFACFDSLIGAGAAWWTSPSGSAIASVKDGLAYVGEKAGAARDAATDLWNTDALFPELKAFVHRQLDKPVDAAQDGARWAYGRLDDTLKGRLERLRQSGAAHAGDTTAVLLGWLNNAGTEQVPAALRAGTVAAIEAFMIETLVQLGNTTAQRDKPYAGLTENRKMLPKSGKRLAASQPRMPWHDVHCSVLGPSVTDLSRNFVRRWNAIAHRYENSHREMTAPAAMQVTSTVARQLFRVMGLRPKSTIRIPRLPSPKPHAQQTKAGQAWVQVLRSASKTMLREEAEAASPGKGNGSNIAQPQNNCLKAMLTAIRGAQKFIYIEGQFFQSAYGADIPGASSPLSGPMAALMDIKASPKYKEYAKRLGIDGVEPAKILSKIRLSQIDDIRRDANGEGATFLNDLDVVLANVATVEAMNIVGKAQEHIINPIGEALAARIEQTIHDGKPFHVYIVLPVHPEGTLNTINIMTQVHLTMQSLVFGAYSFVNRIRRAILSVDLRSRGKLTKEQAIAEANEFDVESLHNLTKDQWKRYLTLLNLRTWQNLGSRPVSEQIYVHSKLLIADDRVAVLGSANINDRSQLGDRDSELAIIVRDDESVNVKIDGLHEDSVSKNVHQLRTSLWRKIFGLMGSSLPAHTLEKIIGQPASEAAWKEIQRVAHLNALIYQNSLPHLPTVTGESSSIWPAWDTNRKHLNSYMPFDERFWRGAEREDVKFSWNANLRSVEKSPVGIQGFIVELPASWTEGENNLSGFNLTILANNSSPSKTPMEPAETIVG